MHACTPRWDMLQCCKTRPTRPLSPLEPINPKIGRARTNKLQHSFALPRSNNKFQLYETRNNNRGEEEISETGEELGDKYPVDGSVPGDAAPVAAAITPRVLLLSGEIFQRGRGTGVSDTRASRATRRSTPGRWNPAWGGT